jgi:hypothetical protein
LRSINRVETAMTYVRRSVAALLPRAVFGGLAALGGSR